MDNTTSLEIYIFNFDFIVLGPLVRQRTSQFLYSSAINAVQQIPIINKGMTSELPNDVRNSRFLG